MFNVAIDEACRTAIGRRKANANWEMRRGFDFYDPNDRRLSGLTFERRVSLVLDRDGGPGTPHSKVIAYNCIQMRNKIALGKLEAKRIARRHRDYHSAAA
jgi:hypothetical protein